MVQNKRSEFGIFSDQRYLQNLLNKSSNKNIIIRELSLPIDSFFIGRKVILYSGLCFTKLLVTKFMVGFKFGEFIFTRKRVIHKKKK